MPKKVVIIGGGIGGLAAACLLAKDGHRVTLLEKNGQLGGRAGLFADKGFRFDMGPSWYLMPEVFEKFFGLLGERVKDHLELVKLRPSYRVFYKDGKQIDITGQLAVDMKTFESIEPGAGQQLKEYLAKSKYIYDVAMEKLIYKNYTSIRSFASPSLIREMRSLKLLNNLSRYTSQYFEDERLQQIMQFPAVFLGANPYKTPAFYSLLNHVEMGQSVYYPMGGMYELTRTLERLATSYGVICKTNTPVTKIITKEHRANGVVAVGKTYPADIVISNAEPQFTEMKLLGKRQRDHSKRYWESRTLAPSGLLLHLGLDQKYDNLAHHNLLFSQDWKKNFKEIFDGKRWPNEPSMYICAPSRTDATVAPKGCENLFVFVPVPAKLRYTQTTLDKFTKEVISTLQKELDLFDLRQSIVTKRIFAVKDFEKRFNSYGGSALGLAHTLLQTAAWRPPNRSKKVKNLYYVGANTQPGIGLPMVLISAQLVTDRISKK